jgi:CRP-like cAMP-binding protein
MPRSNLVVGSVGNQILGTLSQKEHERLLPHLEAVELRWGQILYEPNTPLTDVFFPTAGVVSIVVPMENGDAVEAGVIGEEGVVGIALTLGATTESTRAIVQIAGTAMRMTARALTEECARGGEFRRSLLRYAHAFTGQISQTAACNRVHEVEARLCRWLLMCQDRMHSSSIGLTHEFLSQMLGVRRSSVTVALGNLALEGLVENRRGVIEILDRERLEASACECYRVVREDFDRLLGPGA